MNYYSFHIGDYASHTRHLSQLEDLAYRRLIDAYYLSETPFVGSPADIAKDIGMTSEIEEVYYVLSKFFESTENGWINKRCDEEIAKYHEKQEQAVKAGKASAEKRLSARSTPVQPTNNQEPITKNQINNLLDSFEGFWICYDKKVGKPNAIKEWKKIKPNDELVAKIMEQARKDKLAKPDNKYRKDPERWLKGKHWEDELIVEHIAEQSKELPLGTDAQIEEAYRVECGGDPRQSRFNSYFEMRKFILDQRDKRKVA